MDKIFFSAPLGLLIDKKFYRFLILNPSLANPHPFRDTDKGIVQDTKINRNLSLGYAALNKLGAERNTLLKN
jgi:hypothetical protein